MHEALPAIALAAILYTFYRLGRAEELKRILMYYNGTVDKVNYSPSLTKFVWDIRRKKHRK